MTLLITAAFHLFVIYVLAQHNRSGNGEPLTAPLGKIFLAWFVYCVPIHIHGAMPLLLAEEMTDMAAHPEVYFGSYPVYCQVDTRYCNMNFFIMIAQGFAAFVLTPLCATAAWGLWRRRSWSLLATAAVCAIQFYTTAMFFAEPLLHETNPISRDNLGLYLFGYWYMNGLWIVVPAIGLYYVARRLRELHEA